MFSLRRTCLATPRHAAANLQRAFRVFAPQHEKPLPPRRVIDESEITESFLKGTGPGGQKINKTSSAVQLKHLPSGLVVKCQGTRSRDQNRKDARKLLGEKLEEMEKGEQSRTAIKAERARVRKASANKKRRRKYKMLAEEKAGEGRDGVEVEDGGHDGRRMEGDDHVRDDSVKDKDR